MSSIDEKIREFVAEQRELLELELQADEPPVTSKPTNEDSNAATILGNLHASDISVGLYGRTVVELAVWSPDMKSEALLTAHRFTVGDEVEIRPKQSKKSNNPSGVISAVSDTFISVALFASSQSFKKETNEDDNDESLLVPPLSLVPKSSVEVHRKLLQALNEVEREGTNHATAGHVVRAMFEKPDFRQNGDIKIRTSLSAHEAFNSNLDESQWEAINFCLQDEQKISLIHGPPGTGKTTTVTELIQQAVLNHQMKVLVTAPSNVAVDTILHRLVATMPPSPSSKKNTRAGKSSRATNLRVVRLGHPARIQSSILQYSLEALVQKADGTQIVADVRKELKSFLSVLGNPKSKSNDKRAAYREVKNLRNEVRTREEKVVQELLISSQVVFSTNVGAANKVLRDADFDLVVIDEAAQALEASCWIPLLHGKKIVLAGDHCQLPPTIKSQSAAKKLGKTMFERLLLDLYAPSPHLISRMLKVQYRMNANIANWASQAMYHGDLTTHNTIANQTLSNLFGGEEETSAKNSNNGTGTDEIKELRETVLLFIDTAGCLMHEGTNEGSGSRYNEGEAEVLCHHVQKLLDSAGLKQNQIAIITPYNGQVEILRKQLLPNYPQLEIRSVDGFQGGEREAVILSLVRSSPEGKGSIGFLKDDRRLNVAITRAKRHLCVIGDSDTVSQSVFIASLLEWIEQNGESRSAMEYMDSKVECRATELSTEQSVAVLLSQLSTGDSYSESFVSKKNVAKQQQDNENISQRQEDLIKEISFFIRDKTKNSDAPAEMALSSELTSLDRKFVHEYAEKVGIHHYSEGIEGKNRRLILTIPSTSPKSDSQNISQESVPFRPRGDEKPDDEIRAEINSQLIAESDKKSLFAEMLCIDESDDDSGDDGGDDDKNLNQNSKSEHHPNNVLLAELAKERSARQKDNKSIPNRVHHPKQRTQKGRKLGGVKKKKKATFNANKDEELMDDMAFLDAQIDKAQNAHGRKIDASGSNYRTIVNGVLNQRPKPKERPTNQAASATLRTKLQDAQRARKPQTKKKKRK